VPASSETGSSARCATTANKTRFAASPSSRRRSATQPDRRTDTEPLPDLVQHPTRRPGDASPGPPPQRPRPRRSPAMESGTGRSKRPGVPRSQLSAAEVVDQPSPPSSRSTSSTGCTWSPSPPPTGQVAQRSATTPGQKAILTALDPSTCPSRPGSATSPSPAPTEPRRTQVRGR
jgi:hypothetical protein